MNTTRNSPKVVLVADRTLSARYRVLFEGMFATMQTTAVPAWLMRNVLAPPMPLIEGGRAWAAPLGLRRLEAALLAQGPLGPDDVAVTTPEGLDALLGPGVEIVGVSSSDPLGQGMSNTTTRCFWDGELYTKHWTDRMLARIRSAKARHGFRVIGGGAGAWQWLANPAEARRQGIDLVVDGYGETAGVAAINALLAGKNPNEVPGAQLADPAGPFLVHETGSAGHAIAPIRGASLLGIVELSRGCGRGCRFCTMAGKSMHHLPPEIILADLETNLHAGIATVVSGSEDFFRYGSDGVRVEPAPLIDLLEQMRRLEGLAFMQLDHANVSSVAQLDRPDLVRIRELLTWERPSRHLWVNLGVESANGHLVAANSAGKIAPFRPDDWEELVREAVVKLQETGYSPVLSLMLGLPGETPADVARTRELVRWLERRHAVVFPIFYEPLPGSDDARFDLARMRPDHLDLYSACYEINFREVPGLFWDNQRAGGVSLAKRLLMRTLGLGEVHTWRRRFARLGRELDERPAAPTRPACPSSCRRAHRNTPIPQETPAHG